MPCNTENIESKIRRDVVLAPYTTFKIGGPARFFVQPETPSEFKQSLEWCIKNKHEFFVMGSGSNILVHDKGYRGAVINTAHLDRIYIQGDFLVAECGTGVDTLVDFSVEHSLTGLEFAAGLPGSVGGALCMNARAYQGEFSRVVAMAQVLKTDTFPLSEITLTRDQLGFEYKTSILQDENYYVSRVYLVLKNGNRSSIQEKISEIRNKRKKAGQYAFPNAGCIFKNIHSTGKPAGRIIDELGLKGKRIGDAQVFNKHANFIVNLGTATAGDVYQLIRFIEEEVKKQTGIQLEREIVLVGNWERL
ncbi:MAG: UDP-N-acetylmuramate dehydrogenase [Spirochaetota bacterium]